MGLAWLAFILQLTTIQKEKQIRNKTDRQTLNRYCVICDMRVNTSNYDWNNRTCTDLSQASKVGSIIWQVPAPEITAHT